MWWPGRLRELLMAWYSAHGRHELPWRRTGDPYAVLVSEVMLQQTQVERVRPYYERWLERWPTLRALAQATPADVIREWAGLGYNRRALYLQRAALATAEQHGGELPLEPAQLLELPGIGPYTAAAVACFAGDAHVSVADTNIQRVLARVRLGRERAKDCEPSRLREAAETLLPPAGARDHNLALMDLGALVCTARAPMCTRCPLADACCWRGSGAPTADSATRRRQVRFEETGRFARGRIVDALRVAPRMSAQELTEMLPEQHRPHTARYLFALEADGLIEQGSDGMWRLPGQGSTSIASPKL